MGISVKDRQREYRQRQKDQGRHPVSLLLTAYDKEIIEHYKKTLDITSDGSAVSYILQTFYKLTHQK